MFEIKVAVFLLLAMLYFLDSLAENQSVTAIKQQRLVKRLAPLKNVSAPPYVYHSSYPIKTTILELTDYTCGKRKLCESSQGFFNYNALCYKCDDCRCDKACHLYGDCCNDLTDPTKPHKKPFLTCQEKLDNRNKRFKGKFGVLMISKCSRRYKNVSSDIINKCVNPDLYEMDQVTPVWAPSSGLTFKNRFCALCHREDKFEPWKIEVACSSSDIFHTVKSEPDVWKVILETSNCTITSKAPTKSDQRQCRSNVIDTCPASFMLKNATLVRLCQSLTSAVFFKYHWYKNVFCAICNGASVDRRELCEYPQIHSGKNPVPPLSVLLKFYPDSPEESRQDSQCPPSSIHNPILGNCSSVLCPPRHVLVDKTCKPVFQSVVGLGYKMHITLLSAKPVRVSTTGYIRRKYESWLRERLDHYKPYVLVPLYVGVRGERVLGSDRHIIVSSLQVSIQIVSTRNVTMDVMESDLRALREESWIFRSRDNPDTEFVSTLNQKQQNMLSSTSKLTDRWEILPTVPTTDSPSVFGRICERKDCLRNVEYLDISNKLDCAHIEIELSVLSHFNVSLQSSSVTRHNKTVQLDNSAFKTFGSKIDICTSQLEYIKELYEGRSENTQEPLWLAILSTVCLAVSCFFLFLTFTIYLLVPELQTLPGKNTMALTLCLLLAQMCYLLGIQATDNGHLCPAVGLIIHYLWLVAIFWMFICGFHMHSVFTNFRDNSKSSYTCRMERKQFVHYILLACLGPIVFVGLCIAYSLAMTSGNNIGYGGQLCFINLIEAKGIFLAGPILLMLIFNVFFYIRTVMAIRATPNVAAHNKCDRNYVGTYLRLAVLLGLGWIFGFVPADFSRVIFLILTGGQGVFIFFAVFLTRTVVKGLSRRLSGCSHFLSQQSSLRSDSEMSSNANIVSNSDVSIYDSCIPRT